MLSVNGESSRHARGVLGLYFHFRRIALAALWRTDRITVKNKGTKIS